MAKINFAISAVQAGQKSNIANAEPRLIANSTPGKFVLTAAVTKIMGIAPGENIAFLNNIPAVQEAIAQRSDAILAWANEAGIDIETRDGQETAVAALSQWYISKGVAMVDKTGTPIMTSVRMSKQNKIDFVLANIDTLIENDTFRTKMAEVLGTDEFGKETIVELLSTDKDAETEASANAKEVAISFVDVDEEQKYSGSKTATTGLANGVGCQLNFTDSNVWNILKSDLEDKTSKNRNFDVILKETTYNEGTEDEETYAPVEAKVNNGKEDVSVIAYPIVFNSDSDPIIREKKEDNE